MTPAELIAWIIRHEATVGPALDERYILKGWVCHTPGTAWVDGKTLQEAVEEAKRRVDSTGKLARIT